MIAIPLRNLAPTFAIAIRLGSRRRDRPCISHERWTAFNDAHGQEDTLAHQIEIGEQVVHQGLLRLQTIGNFPLIDVIYPDAALSASHRLLSAAVAKSLRPCAIGVFTSQPFVRPGTFTATSFAASRAAIAAKLRTPAALLDCGAIRFGFLRGLKRFASSWASLMINYSHSVLAAPDDLPSFGTKARILRKS
jgi:hypothetical protein